jgi:hypothetical protein
MQFRFIIKTAGHLYRTLTGAIIGPHHQTDGKPAANPACLPLPFYPSPFTPACLLATDCCQTGSGLVVRSGA